MTKFFLGMPILVYCVLLVAATKAQDEIESPVFPSTYLVDDDDSDGEICDPSTQNACESPQAECIWNPRDMMYRCNSQHYRGNREALLRMRQVKRRKVVDQLTKSDHYGTVGTSTQKSELLIPRLVETESVPIWKIRRPIKNSQGRPQRDDSAYKRVVVAQERQAKAKDTSVGTREVPEYEGLLTWDGKTEFSETCVTKTAMADALQESKPKDSKVTWITDNKDDICDFKKFFHCTIEQADTELQIDPNEDYDQSDNTPVCRCYESAMPVVNGMCYIPAEFGTKSVCGEHVHAPYPIQAWKGAPILRPKCTPNSECKESQYWFGKRCTCRFNAKWNSQTHTCDNGMRIKISGILLSASILILFCSRLPSS